MWSVQWSPSSTTVSWPTSGKTRVGWTMPARVLRPAHVGLGLVPGDLANLAHDLRHALRFADDGLGLSLHRLPDFHASAHDFSITQNAGEGLIQLVGGGARQLGDDGLLLALAEL